MECDWDMARRIMVAEWGGRIHGNKHGKYVYLYGIYDISVYYRSSGFSALFENPKLGDCDMHFEITGDAISYMWIKAGKIIADIHRRQDNSLGSVIIRDGKNYVVIRKDDADDD